MKDLFYMGGPLFMGILSILLVIMVSYAVIQLIAVFSTDNNNLERVRQRAVHIKSIGLFSMITGILGQLNGLYEAFSAIEKASDIAPSIIFGGLKVSMITTLFGIIIYLFSILLWLAIDFLATRKP